MEKTKTKGKPEPARQRPPLLRCGECALFGQRDVDGTGWCYVTKKWRLNYAPCRFVQYYASPDETVRLLHYGQKMRRSGKSQSLPPILVGLAIDNAIRHLRLSLKRRRRYE